MGAGGRLCPPAAFPHPTLLLGTLPPAAPSLLRHNHRNRVVSEARGKTVFALLKWEGRKETISQLPGLSEIPVPAWGEAQAGGLALLMLSLLLGDTVTRRRVEMAVRPRSGGPSRRAKVRHR